MTYVIADIHGCYKEYLQLLELIGFSDEDELYVLGDAMDRGPEPIKVIQDLMSRPNVNYVLGNHDEMMLSALKPLAVEITEESISKLKLDANLNYQYWVEEGGAVTAEQFAKLTKAERADIIDYLENALPYEMLEHEGELFVLLHAGISNFDHTKELDEYHYTDFLWERMDYTRRYYPSERIHLVSGHTPTMLIGDDEFPSVYIGNGHIAIDCGCVFGGNLAAYCIENGSIAYVESCKEQEDE